VRTVVAYLQMVPPDDCCLVVSGFIAMALKHGYSVSPCFIFGEEKTYWACSKFLKARMALNPYKLPGVIFVGGLGLVPWWNQPLITVIGKPLSLPRIEKPSTEDVDKHHQAYIRALVALFERNRAKFADPGAELEVW
jgi:2-acylglycerol O-acyltransferase 2